MRRSQRHGGGRLNDAWVGGGAGVWDTGRCGVPNATKQIQTGYLVRINGDEGYVEVVGRLTFFGNQGNQTAEGFIDRLRVRKIFLYIRL